MDNRVNIETEVLALKHEGFSNMRQMRNLIWILFSSEPIRNRVNRETRTLKQTTSSARIDSKLKSNIFISSYFIVHKNSCYHSDCKQVKISWDVQIFNLKFCWQLRRIFEDSSAWSMLFRIKWKQMICHLMVLDDDYMWYCNILKSEENWSGLPHSC